MDKQKQIEEMYKEFLRYKFTASTPETFSYKEMCEHFYNAGYRKEEQTRKETAEKFAERLKKHYPPRTDKRCTLDDCYMLDKIDEICKELGGE